MTTQVQTGLLADGSVTATKLADGAVTPAKLGFGGALAGMRNLIINGNPVVNQRAYVSGTATGSANQYTLDRWRVVTSGQSVSWSDSAGVRTVTAPAGGMEQVVEALNNLGGVHTLSWAGTATATVNGATVANGGQVTLTGNTDVTVRMSGGTWAQLQLEPGSAVTPFERRLYGVELAMCQRYYLGYGMAYNLNVGSANSTKSLQASWLFPVTMRASPTITIKDVAGTVGTFTIYNGVVNAGQSFAAGTINASAFGFEIDGDWTYAGTPYGTWCKFFASFSAEM